jgi:hypothetical protein
MGPFLVVSQGKSLQSKQNCMPLVYAQLQIWQNLFSLATQPTGPLGQVPLVILGHFSHAIPHTPTFKAFTYTNHYAKGSLKQFSLTRQLLCGCNHNIIYYSKLSVVISLLHG